MDLDFNIHGRKQKMESPGCYKTGSLSRKSIKKKWEIICVISKKSRAKDLRKFVMVPNALDALNLTLPPNVQTPRFRLSILVVREKWTNRAAQTNRIGEPKAAAKILNLAPRIKKITDDDRRRLEAQNLIKEKRKKREEKRKKHKEEDEQRHLER